MTSVFKENFPKQIIEMREYADNARRKRIELNKYNLDMFHMRQDYSNKKPGQSTEFIPKIGNSTNKFVSFLKQGVAGGDDWFSVEPDGKWVEKTITAKAVEAILKDQIEAAGFSTLLEDVLQIGALQSLMIAKVEAKDCKKYSYETEVRVSEDGSSKTHLKRLSTDIKKLSLSHVRPENWFPDPTTDGLFRIEDIYVDKYKLIALAEANPGLYNIDVIRDLHTTSDENKNANLSRETDQYMEGELSFRKRIKVTEIWGTFLDQDGEVVIENGYCAIANDRDLICDPRKNDFWHGEDPYVVSPILRVAGSEWHMSLMDTAARLNAASNDIYNLMLDSALMSVFGVRQIKTSWLEDPTQIENGIPPATTLAVNDVAPPGAKVMERIDTGGLSREAMDVYTLTEKELNSSSFENSYSLGTVPDRQVKATEVVAANQATTGVFSGLVKSIEDNFVAPLLKKAWLTIAQEIEDFDRDRLITLVGEEMTDKILAMTPEERFAETAQGLRFKVFGMTKTLNKINDYRKITTLLQTIAGSPELMQAFMQKFDMTKLLDEIIRNLDIDTNKIAIDQSGGQAPSMNPGQIAQTLQSMLGGQGQQGGLDMSKTPRAESMTNEQGVTPPISQMNSGGMTTPMGTETA